MFDKLTHQSSRFFLCACTSVCFGIISLLLLIPTLWSSKLVLVKVADLEAGRLPESNWVVIDDGKLLWNESFQMIERFSRKYIVPIVSAEWQSDQPVAAFAVMPVEEGDEMGDYETIQGLCRLTGLDRQIKQQIDGHVHFTAAERHIMVQHGTDPGMDRNLGLILCGVCFLTAVLAVFLYNDQPKPVRDTFDVAEESEPTSPPDDIIVEPGSAQPAPESDPHEVSKWLRERGIQYEESESQVSG